MKQIPSMFIAALFLLLISFNTNAAENFDWKEQYYLIIEGDNSVLNKYTIFDIDDNGIPELVCAFYDSNSGTWLLLIYTAENNQIVEIGRLEIEDYWSISLVRPSYPNKGYLILSDRGENAHYIGSGTAYFKITADGLRANSEKIAVIEEGWKNGQPGIYYQKDTYHPNELEYVYKYGDTPTTKVDFISKLSLGTPLNFLSCNSSQSFEYEWEILSGTPALYSYPLKPMEDTPHSSNPILSYDMVFYGYTVLENENEFTAEVIYPSGIREFSVHNDSGVIFVMVNGSFINCGAIIENGIGMLPARFIFEALGKKVLWDDDSRTINVSGKNMNLILTTDSPYAQINGEDITLNTPPIVINGLSYFPISLFYNNLGITVDHVPNLLPFVDNATIIALENIYPNPDIISEKDIRKRLVKELTIAADKITGYKEPFEDPSFVTNLGRYYIYNSSYINGGGVLMVNKYTGEVYTIQHSHVTGFYIISGIYTR